MADPAPATLTTASVHRMSWGRSPTAYITAWTLPISLESALFSPPVERPIFIHVFIMLCFLILVVIFSGLSLGKLWSKLDDSSETLADIIRDAGANPEAITVLTCLAALTALLSSFSYFAFFLLRDDLPPWQRRWGTGSYMLYANAVLSGLEIIVAATLVKLLSLAPMSSMSRALSGKLFYVPAILALIQGGISMSGFVLMIAGPSPVRLPDNYEPIARIINKPDCSTANMLVENVTTRQDRCLSRAAPDQSLAAMYRAQQQQRQELVIKTRKYLMSPVPEQGHGDQVRTGGSEMARLGVPRDTLTTQFDNRLTYWTPLDPEERVYFCCQVVSWTFVLFWVYTPIQLFRFISYWTRDSPDSTSPCYLDLVTPFLGALAFITIHIIVRRRINLRRKLWPYGPSTRALLIVFYFSTIVIYIVDLVLLGVIGPKKTFNADLFKNNNGLYVFLGFMIVLVVVVACLGRSMARRL